VNQFSRAGNDAGKAIGLINALNNTGTISSSLIWSLTLVAALMYGIGLFTVGRYIIENVGNTTGGSLRPSEALAIESTTAIIILISTLLGLPVSGGHILIFAMVGTAAMKGEKPDPRSFRMMVMSWILTFPITATLSAIFYGILNALF
jgi:inorganic phosphate transporter, PiT family